jgi:RNA polymerase sigma-70 factor, ECF subfamily
MEDGKLPGQSCAAAQPGEAALVLAAIRGDEEAAAQLFSDYRDLAIRIARRYVGSQSAEDVAQDSLILAFRHLKTLSDPGKFAPWLGRIVQHRALRVRAEVACHLGSEETAASRATSDASSGPDESLLRDLRTTLKQLPPEFAEALGLHFLEEVPLEGVSVILGIPVTTVKWRIHRGKQLLRQLLTSRKETVQRQELDWIRLALRALPAKIRSVLFEHALDGLSVAEIAASRKLSEAFMEEWIALGRQILRKELMRIASELERRTSVRRQLIPCETCSVPKACLSSVCPLVRGGLLKRRSGVLQNAYVFAYTGTAAGSRPPPTLPVRGQALCRAV